MSRRLLPRYLITDPPYDGPVHAAGISSEGGSDPRSDSDSDRRSDSHRRSDSDRRSDSHRRSDSDPRSDSDSDSDPRSDSDSDRRSDSRSHWVRWHQGYEDPSSALSLRLHLVKADVGAVLDARPPGSISVVSLCAGQGRDVIDVLAAHPRRADVRALLVESDPDLVEFARSRADAVGVGDRVEVLEGDASEARQSAGGVPADLVLVCGVFGNISDDDIAATIAAVLPSFCAPGASVIWTRHRSPP